MRRRVLPALLLALLVLAVGCGDDADERTSPQPTVAGEFVGTAGDGETYVGVYVSGASSGSDVVAYVCNRRVGLQGVPEVAEWFTGKVAGTDLDLTSQSGRSHLKGTLQVRGPSGTVHLPDGRSVTFQTARSDAGPAGIFEVSLDKDGNLVGTSRAGKRFILKPFRRDGLPGYQGEVTLADGSKVPNELFVRGGHLTPTDIAGMGTPRTVILQDGSSRGILDPIPRKGKETAS